MTVHVQIELDEDTRRRAEERAAALGLSLEDYLQRVISGHLPPVGQRTRANVSSIIGIGSSREPTDVARDKDRLVGEAVWKEYLEETGRK